MKSAAFWSGALAGLAGLAAPTVAWAQQQGGPYYGHMWDGEWHGWFFGPFFMMLFFIVMVVIIVLLVRWLGGPHHGPMYHGPVGKTPLDILKERFARGEIDKQEFEERRRVLGE